MAKRANGEGTLFQREDGIWICQIMIGYRPDGKRDIRTFSGSPVTPLISGNGSSSHWKMWKMSAY